MKERTKLGRRSMEMESFSDAAFTAVTLSIPLALFSLAETRTQLAHIFSIPCYALGTPRAAEDLYQVRGDVAPILRERCDKVTLRNWLSWRGERLAGGQTFSRVGNRVSLSRPYPSFLPSVY